MRAPVSPSMCAEYWAKTKEEKKEKKGKKERKYVAILYITYHTDSASSTVRALSMMSHLSWNKWRGNAERLASSSSPGTEDKETGSFPTVPQSTIHTISGLCLPRAINSSLATACSSSCTVEEPKKRRQAIAISQARASVRSTPRTIPVSVHSIERYSRCEFVYAVRGVGKIGRAHV